MGTAASAAVAFALLFDTVLGEPPESVHPVARFGQLVAYVDREWSQPRRAGVVIAVSLPVGFGAVLSGITRLARQSRPVGGIVVAGLCLFTTLSLRRLLTTGNEVIELTTESPDRARTAIRALVGRETDALSPAQLRSGAVESLAENLADGLVAPLCGFLVGSLVSLPAAVGTAAWVKGVNTLDSMLGYESRQVGWASARLDDAVMWVPARLTAVLIAVAGGDVRSLARARAWADTPRSPNSGWPMATLAALLDVRLHKPGSYCLNPAGSLPRPGEAKRGLIVVAHAGILTAVLAMLAGVISC